jgi:hypothetical protein
MDVLQFLSIAYKAYNGSPLKTLVYEGASLREKFNGLIIESYYGIFCSRLITRFGVFRISYGGSLDDFKPIEEYIKSRITYKEIIKKNSCRETGCAGPFYLVTHIDGIPVENDNVEGITYETYYNYVYRSPSGLNEFPSYIEDCIRRGIIKDSMGMIDRLLAEPEYYPEAVTRLIDATDHPRFHARLKDDMFFHIFGLLYQKRALLF